MGFEGTQPDPVADAEARHAGKPVPVKVSYMWMAFLVTILAPWFAVVQTHVSQLNEHNARIAMTRGVVVFNPGHRQHTDVLPFAERERVIDHLNDVVLGVESDQALRLAQVELVKCC